MKVANIITAKQTDKKQLELPEIEPAEGKKLRKSMDNRLLVGWLFGF